MHAQTPASFEPLPSFPPSCLHAYADTGLFAALEARSLYKEIILLLGSSDLMLIPLLQVGGGPLGRMGKEVRREGFCLCCRVSAWGWVKGCIGWPWERRPQG